VEIEGPRGLSGLLHHAGEPGMKVRTQTPSWQSCAGRDGAVHLRPPAGLPDLPANGNCELQDMAGVVGLREVRYGYDGANHPDEEGRIQPYFTYDPSKCIVCNRCVRACEETQGTFALTISGRGFESRVSAGQGKPSWNPNACPAAPACRPARPPR
jgi:formate dehydrogenase major subunit